ncbi:hypothetical protein BUALT_Bualt04G0054200 [Buddleja alternifolia]|uniref:Zinc finger GRF-type domain-containing protein n=1 Tax=Buddleja alternifolia TaxID=168488 RepID=A0AAV6XLJ0_9LAMI|nr:hypothetical protein BUALT_Bualt04G0054200 [Buddleja alternifolia]
MSSRNIGQVECECGGHKLAKLYTSWTNDNPGRRFHAWRKYKGKGKHTWLVTGRNELEVEVCKLRERAQKLQKKLAMQVAKEFFVQGHLDLQHQVEDQGGFLSLFLAV